ncbi:L,D-transpeptidase [uncultured Roseivirga sp.]|uniref:L,D-transpeptidase n=1 Tax=uncultured Roseivirga sp. TaxID=543088 RepID=UPI0030D8C257|tara:strand:- start:1147 stop:1803 length:657 start_codon:yes stop_codon:yes gene_type:complete
MEKKRNIRKWVILGSTVVLLLLVLAKIQTIMISIAAQEDVVKVDKETEVTLLIDMQNQLAVLDKKLSANIPKNNYLVVNSTVNEFYLYKGTNLVKSDICSTGSYILLKGNDSKKQWMFKTPKGEFKILNKTKDPVWKKPDWAFVEEGLPVPSPNHSSRFEYGVLGDYSLSIGDGYLIHGTLYQRFLGLPVTHGCIRLDDANLELVYKSLPIGSKVFIF